MTNPSLEVTTLPNGLRVVTDPVPTVETVCVGVWVGVGTRHEAAPVNGVAHLLEHMAFKGTRRRSALDIAAEIENVGGHMNAYTSRENTAYYCKVLKEDAGLALDVLADILQYSVLDEAELGRERTVVLQEIGQAHDTPDDIIFDHFQATAFPDQALGRPVLGTPDIVRGLGRNDLRSYLDRHYGGEGLVVVASGAITHEAFVAMVAEAFSSLDNRHEPQTDRARFASGEYREARDLEQVHFLLGFEGVSYHDPDFYTANMLSTLLGGGMSSRLFQEIREKRGLVYSVYTYTSAYRDGGLFGVYAGTGGDDLTELVPVLADEIAKVADDVTEQEVNRARAQLKASLLMGLESTMGRAEQLGQQLLVYGRPVSVDEMVGKLDSVTVERVSALARRLFSTRPVLAAMGPVDRLEPFDRLASRFAG